jgi:hypothetical protein
MPKKERMFVNFRLGFVVLEFGSRGSWDKKRIMELMVDRMLGEKNDVLEVVQSQGMVTCRDTTPIKVLKPGTRDHKLMKDLEAFFKKWCLEFNPFEEES